jgi:integrase
LVDVDRDGSGRRRRVALGTFSTRKQAESAEREALIAKERGGTVTRGHGRSNGRSSASELTVAGLLDRYLQDRAARVSARTLERYEDVCRLYVVPHIGALPVAKLRPARISEMLAVLRERGGENGKPISPATVKYAFVILRGALAWGVRQELVARNVCDAVEPPSVGRSSSVALSVEEANQLLAVADAGRWGPFLRLALATGARRGELLALRWTNVDFPNAQVTIKASLSYTRAGTYEKSTKTDKARIVALSTGAVEALRRQRVLQAEDRLAAGSAYDDSGRVFQPALGGTLHPLDPTVAFRKIAQMAGMGAKITLHSLRHSCGSWLIASGVDVQTVASVLGHSSPNVTLGVYSHLVAGRQAAAVGHIDAMLATPKKA